MRTKRDQRTSDHKASDVETAVSQLFDRGPVGAVYAVYAMHVQTWWRRGWRLSSRYRARRRPWGGRTTHNL